MPLKSRKQFLIALSSFFLTSAIAACFLKSIRCVLEYRLSEAKIDLIVLEDD